jgi:hypothetical protein
LPSTLAILFLLWCLIVFWSSWVRALLAPIMVTVQQGCKLHPHRTREYCLQIVYLPTQKEETPILHQVVLEYLDWSVGRLQINIAQLMLTMHVPMWMMLSTKMCVLCKNRQSYIVPPSMKVWYFHHHISLHLHLPIIHLPIHGVPSKSGVIKSNGHQTSLKQCSCQYPMVMGLPCRHMLRVMLQLSGTVLQGVHSWEQYLVC